MDKDYDVFVKVLDVIGMAALLGLALTIPATIICAAFSAPVMLPLVAFPAALIALGILTF